MKPTLDSYRCEDKTEMIDITVLKREAEGAKRFLAFSGTDRGLCTLSATVALSMERYEYQYKLYECFCDTSPAVEEDPAMEIDEKICPDIADMLSQTTTGLDDESSKYRMLPLPEVYAITAQQLNEISGARKFAKLREKRKAGNTAVLDAEKALRQHSFQPASTSEEVVKCQKVCHEKSHQNLSVFTRISRLPGRIEMCCGVFTVHHGLKEIAGRKSWQRRKYISKSQRKNVESCKTLLVPGNQLMSCLLVSTGQQ